MKRLTFLILILTITSFACTLAVGSGESQDSRSILTDDRPSVALLIPTNGSHYALGTEILIYAEARDLGAGVVRIEFIDNFDNKIGTVTATQAQPELKGTVRWKPIAAQTYLIRAQAYRTDDTASHPQEISVVVEEKQGVVVVNSTQDAPNPTQSTSTTNSATNAPPAILLEGVVRTNALNVRSEPNTNAARIAPAVTDGEVIQLVGRSEDQAWYLIRLENGDFGWVFGEFVEVRGDANTLPTVKPDEVNQ